MKTKASAQTLKVLNEGLESFNDKSAMNFDGPGKWIDWAITSVESDAKRHVVKVKAGKKRVTLKVPPSIPLVEGDEAGTHFILRVLDLVDDDTEDPNAGRLAPIAAPKLTDAQRRAFKEQQEQERLARIAKMEAEAAAVKPPTLAELKKALAERFADRFQSLLERTDGTLRKDALELLFKQKKKDADFVAEAIRPVLRSVKLKREQWALVARASRASSVVIDFARARS